MNILNNFKQNGYFTSELYQLLSKKKVANDSEAIVPSEYIKELSLSATDRLKTLKDIEIENLVSSSHRKEKILKFSPQILIFQNYNPNDTITAKFSVINTSKTQTYLNMVYAECSYFAIKPNGGKLLSRLAPGISITFVVTFTPIQFEDYVHKVTFYTEKDEYVLPLIGMGPRPVFDFPDRVVVPKTPLKIGQDLTIAVRNIGTIPAYFSLITRCPFYVQPKTAFLKPREKVEVKITFKTIYFGEIEGELNAYLETGENFLINLVGETYIINIELEKQTVRFLDTYSTLVRQVTFKITNKSSILLSYFCMKNESVKKDFEDKINLATVYYNLKESESIKYRKLVEYDVLRSDEHERVYTRIFYDEIQALAADESFLFQDTHFGITPTKGNLWPNKTSEMTLFFEPKEVGEFESLVFLDVDGVPGRIPLKLVGTSLPPAIHLNIETLDMDCVYINKIYNYEVIAINKGHINGVIVYKELQALFGSKITCTPEKHFLAPGEQKVFIIAFCNSNQGPFFEEMNFCISETNVILKHYLKGEIIYPTLTFSVPCLDFGVVSLGIPKTLTFEVINESVVEVKGSVKISSDGPEISSMTLRDYAEADKPKPVMPEWPREFEIFPNVVDIDAESQITLTVILTANLVRANQTTLEIEFFKSDSPPIVLPVVYNATVPTITPAPEINLRACFVDNPYHYDLALKSNEYWGYFTVGDPDEEATLKCDIKIKEGFIEPNSTIILPIVIETSVFGSQELDVRLHLFGVSHSIEVCHVKVCGVRPIMTCTPMSLHWGQVKLLTRSQKYLTICNDSPVYVNFKASLLYRDCRWQIEPSEGSLPPESETDLAVLLYLNDAAFYQNKIIINLEKVKDIMVPLSATGIGTSILVDKSQEIISLGRHFTKIPFIKKVIIENKGTRLHSLEWCEFIKPPKTKGATSSFYKLEPKILKLTAEEEVELIISGISNKETTMKETWYLFGNVEGINKKELLLEISLIGEFVDPKIELTPSTVDLQYDYGPYNEFYKLTDIITIKNVSGLLLDLEISLKSPFAMIQKSSSYKVLEQDENLCCCICYEKSDINIPNMSGNMSSEDVKTFVDYLTLKPVELLRHSPLNFFQDIHRLKMAFNLTHFVEERLNHGEVMKIQVIIDTTKHTSSKSRIYTDTMKIKFKGHKNKDSIKLVGKINFPNISIMSPRLDFRCILNGNTESNTIKIQNMTPLVVCYKFQWKKCIITDAVMPEGFDLENERISKASIIKSSTEDTQHSEFNEILVSRTPRTSEAVDGDEVKAINLSCDDRFEESIEVEIDPLIQIKKVIQKTIPMIDIEYHQEFNWRNKIVGRPKNSKYLINDMFQLTPHRGILKPNEAGFIQVIFRPNHNVNVKAILECHVLGGPTETTIVTGQSASLCYKLNTQKLKYKIRTFHECASEQLAIKNTSLLPFEYKTYVDESNVDSHLEGTIVNVVPGNKSLEPEETVLIDIIVNPGIVGYFKRVFLLELSHLPHIPIEIMGWGVFPQMHLSLNRPDIAKICPAKGYLAISYLTTEFLQRINELFQRDAKSDRNPSIIDKNPEYQLSPEWHICSKLDEYPEVMDIELAIERMLVIKHVKKRPELIEQIMKSNSNKMYQTIHGFTTIPYVIDYGVIITGNTTQCIANISNYGPIAAKPYLVKGNEIPPWLHIKLCGKLRPGEVGTMEVVFSPTSEYFPQLEETVETSFNLEIPYGVTIPILIRATCAVPFLVSNVATIDFGAVKCGDKVLYSVPLKNIGKTTCVWWVTLRLKTVGSAPITVLDTSGKYEHNEGGWLRTSFKPVMEMNYEGLLIFRFHMNPNKMTIPIRGQGVCPHVHVIGPNVEFRPTLPYSETTDIYFGITNPCIFPIELIVAHTDVKWKEEEEIYNILHKYYNKPAEMLVPAITAGSTYPEEIMNFYTTLKERIKKIMIEDARATTALPSKSTSAAVKKGKSPKSAQTAAKGLPTITLRTEAEIMNEEMGKMKDDGMDPLQESLAVFHEAKDENEDRKNGIIIFIHASPCEETQFQEVAYTIGKRLLLPTVNIDICIAHALCVCRGAARDTLKLALEEMYENFSKSTSKLIQAKSKVDKEESEVYERDDSIENMDELELMWMKIDLILNSKSVLTPKSKQAQSKPKKKSPTSSVASQTAFATSSIFELEGMQELLMEYFSDEKFSRGFIVDTLTSSILKNPAYVLTTILKCKPTITNIHLVLCHSEFTKWATSYEDANRESVMSESDESKIYEAEEIMNIISKFEDMDEIEYANANPELKAVYVKHGLEERRRKHMEKVSLEDLNAIVQKKDRSAKSLTTMDVSQSQKKVNTTTNTTSKKDDISAVSKKLDNKANAGGKPTSEYLLMNTKYNEYIKNTFDNLVNIANNWIVEECEMAYPLLTFNGQVVGANMKKTKKKSELQIQLSSDMETEAERGFPFTILTCPCLQFKETLVTMLTNSPVVIDALKEKEQINLLHCPVKQNDLTVLHPKTNPALQDVECLKWKFLDEPIIKKCECSQIGDLNMLDDATQEIVIQTLSKWHCICGKKVTSSQTSTTEIPSTSMERGTDESSKSDMSYPLPLRSVKSLCEQGMRLVLQPGDLVRCKYAFSPTLEGSYSLKRYVEVKGWPQSRVVINISGICDIPRLDSRPKKMFDNFVRRRVDGNLYKHTYLDDLKSFEFGPIFAGLNRVYEEEYSINLKNASLITTNIVVEFLEETNVFSFDQDSIVLEPGCKGKLKITAAPSDIGVFRNVLLFCIKDNPEIVKIELACSGVMPIIEILPLTKFIDYGKLLLYRREENRIIVKNDSILPIMWEIRNADEFAQDFVINRTSGVILANENEVIPVVYMACTVGVIMHKVLMVDIYDSKGRGDPMIVEMLYLSAECYDVLVECIYDHPSETSLNYGNVKVNSVVTRDLYLLNKGKYNIYYKLKKVKNFPFPSLLSSMDVSSEHGLIPPSIKSVGIQFRCTPNVSMNLTNVPAFMCYLLDGNIDQIIVAKFPICITIASFYNTFTLFPLGELNFHIIPVGGAVIREVIINNTSKCPITYEIMIPQKYVEETPRPFEEKTKGKDNKLKFPSIKCGNFLIDIEDNLLEPNSSRIIQIHFIATAANKYEETIHFIISDTCPAEANGVPLKLVGTGALPILDIWHLETTFREHLIVRHLLEYKERESIPHCVFIEDSVTLHFFCVIINTSYTATLDLYNNGLVPCMVSMLLHYQANCNPSIYSLDKYQATIEPLMHKNLGVIFSPRALEEYRAVLEIKLKLLGNQEKSFKICLIGEGVIPRIEIISPRLKQQKMGFIHFPVTCLGAISHKCVLCKNIASAKCTIYFNIIQHSIGEKPLFWLTLADDSLYMLKSEHIKEKTCISIEAVIDPDEVCTLVVYFDPVRKGRAHCDIFITIDNNPYECYTMSCEAEAFMEDIILQGLELLPIDSDGISGGAVSSTGSTLKSDGKKKSKSAESKQTKKSLGSVKQSTADIVNMEPSILRYILVYGGCELCVIQKRTVIMINNSEKLYKFSWQDIELVLIKPSVGFISPGEEKDFEVTFYSSQPTTLKRETLKCTLSVISNDIYAMGNRETAWANNQTITVFERDRNESVLERYEGIVEEQPVDASETSFITNTIMILVSANTEYIKYTSNLQEDIDLKDTFIYQTKSFDFKINNTGIVPMKISWSFQFDEEFPSRLDKVQPTYDGPVPTVVGSAETSEERCATRTLQDEHTGTSVVTLFSEETQRDSVDTWFEMNLPFTILPEKVFLLPGASQDFRVSFTPLDAFYYKVRLKSSIDNLNPYDQNVSTRIVAKALIPYCHLDLEESDYVSGGRRKITEMALPPDLTVLEFDVVGTGCFEKTVKVINPTNSSYELIFDVVLSSKPEMIPVHCNRLKNYVEGGTSIDVTFTFTPTSVGIVESLWRILIPVHSLVINLLVVGIVREPEVTFVPTILTIRNSLVGFTIIEVVKLKNTENESLTFEFKGNSLCNESGKQPIIMEPNSGVLKPCSETHIRIKYTPIEDGPLAFKIFCSVQFVKKYLTLCVHALSHLVKPQVLYYLVGYEHVLNTDAVTNIHLEKTASTYERTVPFVIKNEGSASFLYEWHYSSNNVRKYLAIDVDPRTGRVAPGDQVSCELSFTLKNVPVKDYPITLSISNGPDYSIYLHAEIEKPLYHFSTKEYDFGYCILNAPEFTYKKNIAITNDDKVPINVHLDFENTMEMTVQHHPVQVIEPSERMKFVLYFKPKQVMNYEFILRFWVNSLCEEIVTIRGEGVPLLIDLYEGCQKSFDLGVVKVGDSVVKEVFVMNHSKLALAVDFVFRDMYGVHDDDNTNSEGTSLCLRPSMTAIKPKESQSAVSRGKMLQEYREKQVKERIATDIQNAYASLKVTPTTVRTYPHKKVPVKIQFKPVDIINELDVQLNMKVLGFERPLVRLSGSATGRSLCFSQNSLQFGRVRRRGCKMLKVMLHNNGDIDTRFWWQPLQCKDFSITPMHGTIAARTNVTFTIMFRPHINNPFIKGWASCNLEGHKSLELAMYGTCIDTGVVQNKTMYFECPVREVNTQYITITNPTDEVWFVDSDLTGSAFETLKEFRVDICGAFEVPLYFKPKSIGKHEGNIIYSPLGESALFVTLIGSAMPPLPNEILHLSVAAKETITERLLVNNLTEFPEKYRVTSEVVKTVPDKFSGYYEITHPDIIHVWGETKATCQWKYGCYETCDMEVKVLFINQDTKDYQFYIIYITVKPSDIIDVFTLTSRARETVQSTLLFRNPLSEDALFSVHSENVTCPDKVKIFSNSVESLLLTFTPLVVGMTEEMLIIENALVGQFIYKMVLKCLPAKEKKLEFTTSLGTAMPIRLRVENKSDVKADFICTTSHPSIQTEKEYQLEPYAKGKFLAWFEPIQLGEQLCVLSFNSSVAGEYVFNIRGVATMPQPQGPIEIKVGGNATVKFKNVFNEVKIFKIYTDREEFVVKTVYETLKPKKDCKIVIFLTDLSQRALLPTGTLTIETYDAKEPKLTWTYFLHVIP